MTTIEKTYSIAEAAAVLKKKTATVRGYCRGGRLKARKIGRDWLILEADLIAFIEGGL